MTHQRDLELRQYVLQRSGYILYYRYNSAKAVLMIKALRGGRQQLRIIR